MLHQKIIFIVVAFLSLSSCSKDKDNQKPVIVIVSPINLQTINGIDTISIIGTVTDNKTVSSVSISLKNNNDISVLSTVVKQPHVADYDLNVLYFFDDIHLSSGTYYFEISASDGENTTTKYIDVIVNSVPKTRENIFIFDNTSSITSIFQLDSTFNTSLFKTISGDFLGGIINSYHQQIVSTGSITGKARGLDSEFANELWDLPLINSPPIPYFTSIFYNDKTVYLGFYNGNIRGYGANGVANFGAQTPTGFYCESGFVHETFLVTEQVAIVNNEVLLGLYWLASGAGNQQLSINENICGMYSLSTNEIVLLTNDASNNGKLSFFNISASGISSPFSIGSGKIDACEEVANGLYLIARNGDINLVNATNFTAPLYLSGVNASLLKYDELTDELFVVSGNALTVYDYSSKMVKGSYTHSNAILDVEFLYNK